MRQWIVALAVIAAGCGQGDPAPAPPPSQSAPTEAPAAKAARPLSYALLGKSIPDFEAPMLGGGSLRDEALAEKWTVILFWGLWCSDCLNDASHTAALSTAIDQDPDLDFVTVHVDDRYGRWKDVQAFFDEKGYAFPVALDPDRTLYKAFQVQWTPTYLLVGPDGVIYAFRTELSRDERPEGGVKAFLKEVAQIKSEQAH